MGIDSIGKKGPPAPPEAGKATGAARPAEASRPFSVGGAAPTAGAGPVEATRPALDRLRAGEIDVKGYVDMKVNEATAHLAALPPAELERVKSALRDRMATDPALLDLVRTATGATPSLPSDE
ncbi:MAG TPA: hypothetical protein VGG39_08375 [Polyangiaceae bacterium]|jgi:hypothetical protein